MNSSNDSKIRKGWEGDSKGHSVVGKIGGYVTANIRLKEKISEIERSLLLKDIEIETLEEMLDEIDRDLSLKTQKIRRMDKIIIAYRNKCGDLCEKIYKKEKENFVLATILFIVSIISIVSALK